MKAHRLAIVLVVLLTTSSFAAAAPAADGVAATQSKVTLTVTVTDDFNNGIANAKLTAEWDGGSATARTASNGKAFLDVPEGATVRIYVEHGSYTLNNPAVVEDASGQDVSIEVFRKAEATVNVRDDGSPVGDAQVTLIKQGESRSAAEGRTDGDGVFTSGTVEKGTYRVLVVKPGYHLNETTVAVSGDTETTVSVTEGTVTVDVTVRDDHFDEPRAVEGATVEFEGPMTASFTTGGSGSGTIGLHVNAKYTVTVSKDGYATKTRTVSVGEESKSLRFTISREDALNVEAVNQRVVVGENVQIEVTDEYGDPVEGASVAVDGETVGQTNAEGVYRATIDSTGDHAITVQKDGVTSEEITVEGVSTGGDSTPAGDGEETATGDEMPAELPDLSQPTFAMKIGAAAVGVLLAFLVVRRLL